MVSLLCAFCGLVDRCQGPYFVSPPRGHDPDDESATGELRESRRGAVLADPHDPKIMDGEGFVGFAEPF
jgi:hypothetical protein